MKIRKATQSYETWLAGQMPVIAADLNLKHRAMRNDPFSLLRATFYRWAQTFPTVCADLMEAPAPLGVGDLHVENFGTWRDIEGRLVWGINDFDEACPIPYTLDLARLATSAHLAIAAGHLTIRPGEACQSILDGYRASLTAGGRPIVLAEEHHSIRVMAVERLKDPKTFWDKLRAMPPARQKIPSPALKGIQRNLPDPKIDLRILHRVAGLGSLGRRRFVGLAEWRGAVIAREAKELTISAWRWARSRQPKSEILYEEILERSIRCPDPFVRQRGRWIVRRLAPDCSRIELSALPAKHDARRLLQAMGWETANVHLGTCKARTILDDLRGRPPAWLHRSAEAMVQTTIEDWEEWKKTPGSP